MDDVGLLSKPGCWSYSPDKGECPSPELSEGRDRTKARLKDRFCWYEMLRDAENYVSTCGPCIRNKLHAGAPMERCY